MTPKKSEKEVTPGKPKYSNAQLLVLLDGYFRDQRRPMPYPDIAGLMGVEATEKALHRLIWGLVTGYTGPAAPDGGKGGPMARRRPPKRDTGLATYREGWAWQEREDDALKQALAGEGQNREPKVDTAYIAAILARSEEAIDKRWQLLGRDSLGREGFF